MKEEKIDIEKSNAETNKQSQIKTSRINSSIKGGRRAKSNPNTKSNNKKEKKRKLSKEEKKAKRYYIDKKGKKRLKKRYKFLIALLALIIVLALIFVRYVIKSDGSVKNAVLNIASDIVGEQDPIFVLILGVSEDIRTPLTDTIILCGYNPKTQKAYMLSVPRDTFVGKNPESANGYDKINAKFQTSAEKTVETVAIVGGGGSREFRIAQDEGYDIFISGDIPHHARRDVLSEHYNFLDVSHEVERIFMPQMKKLLLEIDPTLEVEIIDHEVIPELIK